MSTTPTGLKRTPLYERQGALGARMVAFGEWELPLEYAGIAAEHRAVRERAGLFDVSHMGEVEIAGQDALAAVQRICSNDAAALDIGQAQYSALTTHEGTFVDDLLVYRLAADHFLLVVNAANIDTDCAWIRREIKGAGDAVAGVGIAVLLVDLSHAEVGVFEVAFGFVFLDDFDPWHGGVLLCFAATPFALRFPSGRTGLVWSSGIRGGGRPHPNLPPLAGEGTVARPPPGYRPPPV